MRKNLKDDIWILSALSTIEKNPEKNYVFSDIRFINEINALTNVGAKLFRIKRGDEPIWFDTAKNNSEKMSEFYPDIHKSEYDWISSNNLITIDNSGSLSQLEITIKQLYKG